MHKMCHTDRKIDSVRTCSRYDTVFCYLTLADTKNTFMFALTLDCFTRNRNRAEITISCVSERLTICRRSICHWFYIMHYGICVIKTYKVHEDENNTLLSSPCWRKNGYTKSDRTEAWYIDKANQCVCCSDYYHVVRWFEYLCACATK